MTSVLMSVLRKKFQKLLSSRCEMCVSNWKQIFWPKKIHSVQGFVKPQLRILPFNSRWSFENFEVGSREIKLKSVEKRRRNMKKVVFHSIFLFFFFRFFTLTNPLSNIELQHVLKLFYSFYTSLSWWICSILTTPQRRLRATQQI